MTDISSTLAICTNDLSILIKSPGTPASNDRSHNPYQSHPAQGYVVLMKAVKYRSGFWRYRIGLRSVSSRTSLILSLPNFLPGSDTLFQIPQPKNNPPRRCANMEIVRQQMFYRHQNIRSRFINWRVIMTIRPDDSARGITDPVG